jgi:hypothetical protein
MINEYGAIGGNRIASQTEVLEENFPHVTLSTTNPVTPKASRLLSSEM